jgi:hypothetical protein
MKTQIDIKSLLCGAAIGVLAVFTLGAGTSSSPVGKYQVTGVSNGTGGWGAVIVDTQSGEAWGMDCSRTSLSAKSEKFFEGK